MRRNLAGFFTKNKLLQSTFVNAKTAIKINPLLALEVTMPLFLMGGGTAAVLYYFSIYSQPHEILDQPITTNGTAEKLQVINRDHIQQDPDSPIGFCADLNTSLYIKKPVDRKKLLNDLVVGKLLHVLFADTPTPFPNVWAIERSHSSSQSYFSFASENMGPNRTNTNLADIFKYKKPGFKESEFTHFGVVCAVNLLFGNTDGNLNNYIYSQSDVGDCNYTYGVDHEYALIRNAEFLTSAHQGLDHIVEFSSPITSHLVLLKTDRSYISKQLEDRLTANINIDIQNGAVQLFYEKFAAITPKELEAIVNSFGTLIHEDEKAKYLSEIKQRQIETKRFLQSQKFTNTDVSLVQMKL